MRPWVAVVVMVGLTWNAYLGAVLSVGVETAHRHLGELVGVLRVPVVGMAQGAFAVLVMVVLLGFLGVGGIVLILAVMDVFWWVLKRLARA